MQAFIKKPIIFIISAPMKMISLLPLSLFQFKARYRELTTLKPIPAYAKRGHATALMKHALNFAYDSGVMDYFLGASNEGTPVYEKLGFEITGSRFINRGFRV